METFVPNEMNSYLRSWRTCRIVLHFTKTVDFDFCNILDVIYANVEFLLLSRNINSHLILYLILFILYSILWYHLYIEITLHYLNCLRRVIVVNFYGELILRILTLFSSCCLCLIQCLLNLGFWFDASGSESLPGRHLYLQTLLIYFMFLWTHSMLIWCNSYSLIFLFYLCFA